MRVTVPAEREAPGEDAFTDGVRVQQGSAAEPVAVVAESATAVAGEVTVLLAALGQGDGAPELAAVAQLAGFDLGEPEASGAA